MRPHSAARQQRTQASRTATAPASDFFEAFEDSASAAQKKRSTAETPPDSEKTRSSTSEKRRPSALSVDRRGAESAEPPTAPWPSPRTRAAPSHDPADGSARLTNAASASKPARVASRASATNLPSIKAAGTTDAGCAPPGFLRPSPDRLEAPCRVASPRSSDRAVWWSPARRSACGSAPQSASRHAAVEARISASPPADADASHLSHPKA
mmetsp:Transcript_1194/g.4466  ORF Transcript_1194/g.4466 Transcript_1194/m.4466 type:complete len:211 (+) Transcript_1194:1382-2014(+)